MSQMFDVSRAAATAPATTDLDGRAPVADQGYAPAPRPRARLALSLRRLPWVALLVTTFVVDAAALLVSAAPVATVAVLALVWSQVPAARYRSGPAVGAVTGFVVRRMAVGVAATVVVLHLAVGEAAVLDDVLLLGAVATAVAAAVSALVARSAQPPRVLVVGDLPQVRGMVARWIDDGSVRVVGGLALGVATELAEAGLTDLGIVSIGSLDDVVGHVTEHPTDLVVVAPGAEVAPDDLRHLSWSLQATRTRVAVVSATDDVAPHRIEMATVGGSTVGLVAAPGGTTPYVLAKDVLDRMLATVIAVMVAPVVLVAAIAIRLDSQGPAFFRQVRVGRDGQPFTMYKLRTMSTAAEALRTELLDLDEGNGVLFKIQRDPRITRVGRLLRSTSLDELPQLINVVLGDMSLVGPRPALPDEVARYSAAERRRLAVKPGITGLWQVSGRSLLGRERSMQLDTSYVDNGRLVGDASIILRTVTAVATRRGAF